MADQLDLVLRFQQLMAPLLRRINGLATRVTITRVDDSGEVQGVQVTGLNGEVFEATREQEFGFTSNPPIGTRGQMISNGGSRTRSYVVSTRHSSRKLNLAPGESAAYNQVGSFVHLKADGTILVHSAGDVIVDSPRLHALHDVLVDGTLTVVGNTHLEANLTVDGVTTLNGVDGSGVGLAVTGHIAGSGQISDFHGSMQAMRVVYNGHTQIVTSGVAQPPASTM